MLPALGLQGLCSYGGHVEHQECRAGFEEEIFLTDGERGSLEPLIPPALFALCEEKR